MQSDALRRLLLVQIHTRAYPKLYLLSRFYQQTMRLIVGMTFYVLMAQLLFAQDHPSHEAIPITAEPSTSQPVITAAFILPTRMLDVRKYKSIHDCKRGVDRIADSLSWLSRYDTVMFDMTRSFDPDIVAAARHCLVQFPVSRVLDNELMTNLRVAVQGLDDSLVLTIVDRWLGMEQFTPRVRAALLDSAVRVLVWEALPPRLVLARTVSEKTERLGLEVMMDRWRMENRLRDAAVAQLDWDAAITSTLEGIRLVEGAPLASLTADERTHRQVIDERAKVNLHWYRFMKNGDTEELNHYLNYMGASKKEAIPGLMAGFSSVGQKAVPVTGDFWFNIPQPGVVSTTPKPGEVSVIVFATAERRTVDVYRGYELLRRFHKALPTVPITLVAATTGEFRGRLIEDSGTEAELIYHYFADSLHLPGAISISTSSFTKLASGHLVQERVSNFLHYGVLVGSPKVVVVGRSGTVIWESPLSGTPGFEADNTYMLLPVVRRLLALPSPSSSSAASTSVSE